MSAIPARAPSRRKRLRFPSLKVTLALVLAAALLAGGWFWLRGSSLVAVERVTVTGAGGPQAPAIRSTLTGLARDMTTLDVDREALRESVARFPVVKSVDVGTDFPHAMQIRVVQRRPVAVLAGASVPVAVASDGYLLPGEKTAGLPVVAARLPYGTRRLTGGQALEQVRLLAVAPDHLLRRIRAVTVSSGSFTVQMAGYPELRLGTSERLESKWAAASRILGDPAVAGASYVDLRVPERPAVGPASGEAEGFVP